MKNLRPNQIVGIVLLISLVLLFVKIPLIDGRSIAAIALLVSAIYLLVKK